jgi:hypothetical protein
MPGLCTGWPGGNWPGGNWPGNIIPGWNGGYPGGIPYGIIGGGIPGMPNGICPGGIMPFFIIGPPGPIGGPIGPIGIPGIPGIGGILGGPMFEFSGFGFSSLAGAASWTVGAYPSGPGFCSPSVFSPSGLLGKSNSLTKLSPSATPLPPKLFLAPSVFAQLPSSAPLICQPKKTLPILISPLIFPHRTTFRIIFFLTPLGNPCIIILLAIKPHRFSFNPSLTDSPSILKARPNACITTNPDMAPLGTPKISPSIPAGDPSYRLDATSCDGYIKHHTDLFA